MTRKLISSRLPVKVLSALFLLAAAVFFAAPAFAATTPSTTIVISQVYGAGGNGGLPSAGGSPYTADYVELFNLSQAPVTMAGWSLQYASATGTSTSANIFNIPTVTIPAGGYYLISGAVTANGGITVPSDLQTAATLAAAAGRVYLVSNTTAVGSLTGSDATTVDFVGYGTTAATFFGTAPAPAPGTLTYDQRVNVCANTNQNGTDFAVQNVTTAAPVASVTPGSTSPHSLASGIITVCTHPATLSNPVATPSTVKAGTSTLLTVTVTPNASTGLALTANTSAFTGGSATQALFDDGTHGDAVAGDHIYSFTLPINAAQAQTTYSIAVTATDSAHDAITGVAIPLTVGSHSSSAVTLTATPAAPTPNVSTTLTATIAPSNATGTVIFNNYGVALNTAPGATVNSGVATFTVSGGFPAGDQQLTAVYSGDTTFNTSTGSLSLGIAAVPTPGFSLGLSNAQVIGSAATPTTNVGVYINAVGGFSSAITLTCSNLPSNVNCFFTPSTITPNAGTNGSFVSSVLTFTTSTSANVKPHINGKTSGLALAFTLLVAPFAFRKRKTAVRLMALLFVLFVGMQVLTGCGNGSVAAGTSTVTITAAGGGITQTGTITVITE